jgi:multicomponent K+:H+ antiporter subunit G
MRLRTDQIQYLGLGSFLIAGMIYAAFNSRLGFAELLITLFSLFITAPVSANLIAQAASIYVYVQLW